MSEWIPHVELQETCAAIPLLGSSRDFICISLKDEDEFVKITENSWCTLRSNICFDEAYRDENDTQSITQICNVYEVRDVTGEEFYLIAFNELDEWDDIRHCVAVPYNKFNLIKFYKEYLMTFEDRVVEE